MFPLKLKTPKIQKLKKNQGSLGLEKKFESRIVPKISKGGPFGLPLLLKA